MRNKQNLHIHTTYADGKNTPEELIQEAIRRGFDSIGFSEHVYSYFSDYPYQMMPEETEDYKAEIASLKRKYKGTIDIFCGLEFELYSAMPNDGFDYLIGSVHYLDVGDRIVSFDWDLERTLAYVRDYFGGSDIRFAKKYFETLCRLPEKGNFDILGHFDLITKNNETGQVIDATSKEYLNAGFEAIHALRGKIPLFEVNTGAVSRGYRTFPYPQMEFIKEFRNCGYGAVITSDCHDKRFLDSYFDEAAQLLAQAGFKTRWILTDGGFREVAL